MTINKAILLARPVCSVRWSSICPLSIVLRDEALQSPKNTFCHEIPKSVQLCQACHHRTTVNVGNKLVMCVGEWGLQGNWENRLDLLELMLGCFLTHAGCCWWFIDNQFLIILWSFWLLYYIVKLQRLSAVFALMSYRCLIFFVNNFLFDVCCLSCPVNINFMKEFLKKIRYFNFCCI